MHCYRLLGSLSDAEDVLQETLLAAWQGWGGFQRRSSPRTWLYRIATNRCLNALRDARRKAPRAPDPPFIPPTPTRHGDVRWLEPFPDQLLEQLPAAYPGPDARYSTQEAVELAFVHALQRVPPRQAAALVLCDVLGYSATDAAAMFAVTPTAIKGLLQRARASLARHRDSSPEPPPPPGSATERDVARRFAAAYTAHDVAAVVALLTDDAWLSMPPAPHEYHGPAAIGAFLAASSAWHGSEGLQLRLHPTRANGQPAFASHLTGTYERPGGLIVLTLAGERVHRVTHFLHDQVGR